MSAACVSVVIPVYNGERWVGEAIRSVLSQTWPAGECLVVDDGSTDGTSAVLAAFGDAIDVLRLTNGGVARARNTGVRNATGTWVAFLDADDVWLPQRLERQLRDLGDAPAGLAYCGLLVTDEHLSVKQRMGVPPAERALANTLLLEPPPVSVAQGALVRRSAFVAVGGFDEEMTTSADSDLVVRLASRHPVRALDEDLVLYRQHGNQMSSDVAALERDMTRCYAKATEDSHFPPAMRPALRRGRANLHLAIGGELLARRVRGSALRHLGRALVADPLRTLTVLAHRAQRGPRS